MARQVTTSRVKLPPKRKEPEQLTIEQVRERFEFGTLERAEGELSELTRLKNECRVATNAANRQQTQAGKAMKQMVADEILAYGDEIQFGQFAFTFDFHHSETIDARKLYDMVVAGKVSLDSFLKCISVQKDMANKIIGAHVVAPITTPEVGNKADVRIRELDKPVQGTKIVKKPPPPASKKKLLRETDEKPVDNVSNVRTSIRRGRRLNVGQPA